MRIYNVNIASGILESTSCLTRTYDILLHSGVAWTPSFIIIPIQIFTTRGVFVSHLRMPNVNNYILHHYLILRGEPCRKWNIAFYVHADFWERQKCRVSSFERELFCHSISLHSSFPSFNICKFGFFQICMVIWLTLDHDLHSFKRFASLNSLVLDNPFWEIISQGKLSHINFSPIRTEWCWKFVISSLCSFEENEVWQWQCFAWVRLEKWTDGPSVLRNICDHAIARVAGPLVSVSIGDKNSFITK